MPVACRTVEMTGGELQDANADNMAGFGGTNRATVSHRITNPNNVGVIATVEYTVDGTFAARKEVSVTDSKTVETEIDMELQAGSGERDVEICANVIDTVKQ